MASTHAWRFLIPGTLAVALLAACSHDGCSAAPQAAATQAVAGDALADAVAAQQP